MANISTSNNSGTSPSMSDFRRNAERQSREQKSVGNVLSALGYALIGGILLVAILAGVGGWFLWNEIDGQKVTVSRLQEKMEQEVARLQEEIDDAKSTAEQQAALLAAQQQRINRLNATTEQLTADLRADRSQRQRERADFERRLRAVETRVQR